MPWLHCYWTLEGQINHKALALPSARRAQTPFHSLVPSEPNRKKGLTCWNWLDTMLQETECMGVLKEEGSECLLALSRSLLVFTVSVLFHYVSKNWRQRVCVCVCVCASVVLWVWHRGSLNEWGGFFLLLGSFVQVNITLKSVLFWNSYTFWSYVAQQQLSKLILFVALPPLGLSIPW